MTENGSPPQQGVQPAQAQRPSQGQPGHASLTLVQAASSSSSGPTTQILQLREPEDNRVQWTDDTIDNENMGKMKSNKCCIYRKPRAFGESSSESSYDGNDDDSSNNSEAEAEGAQHSAAQQHDHAPGSTTVNYDRPTFTRTRRTGASDGKSTWSQKAGKTPPKETK